MIARVAVRNLIAHKLRLLLTLLAIVLGVAFVTGSMVFTDTIKASFDALFSQIGQGTDVDVRAVSTFQDQEGGQGQRRPISESLLTQISAVPGVAKAIGTVNGFAVIIGKNGKAVASAGPPTIGIAWNPDKETSPEHMVSGRAPVGPNEVAIDANTAQRGSLAVGDTTTVLLRGPSQKVTVVGEFRFGSVGSLGGATITAFDLPTAQKLLLAPGQFNEIRVRAQPGVSQTTLRDRIAPILPHGVEALTGKQLNTENAGDVQRGLSFLGDFLLAFALVSVFVGAFIIFNTFTMLVAQRTRELALLRAVGASRAQVTRLMLGEALGVGVISATLGLLAGIGIAIGLRSAFNAFGLEPPSNQLTLAPRTIITAYAVGVVVTLAASYFPARRAARIPPVAALRDDVALPSRSLRWRLVAGSALAVIGVAVLSLGLANVGGSGGNDALLVGGGGGLVFIGVTMLSPALSRPVVRVLAAPYGRIWGAAGKLSRQNALRNPRRTAATASALMIGLALVAMITVLNSSINASVGQVLDQNFGADYIIASSNFQPFGTSVATAVSRVPGVTQTTPIYSGRVKLAGGFVNLTTGDPAGIAAGTKAKMKSGVFDPGADGILISQALADSNHLSTGSVAPIAFSDGVTVSAPIRGVFANNQLLTGLVMAEPLYRAHFASPLVELILVKGNGLSITKQDITSTLMPYPNLQVLDEAGIKAQDRKQLASFTLLIVALLVLSIIIAALGIVNTLALSVIERTREIGLLRAVGMSRRQLRTMIRWESVAIAVFGGLLGIVVGVAFAIALQRSLTDQGLAVLSVPVPLLLLFVVIAGIIGVLAAILPAWRASRLDVLRAIAME